MTVEERLFAALYACTGTALAALLVAMAAFMVLA